MSSPVQLHDSDAWAKVFIGVIALGVLGTTIVGYKLTLGSDKPSQAQLAVASAPNNPAQQPGSPASPNGPIGYRPIPTTVPPTTLPPTTTPPVALEAPSETVVTVSVPTNDGAERRELRAAEPMEAGNALDKGACLQVARPMPRPTRFQRMRQTFARNGTPAKHSVELIRDSELGAYQYSTTEYDTTSIWRVFSSDGLPDAYRIVNVKGNSYDPPRTGIWASTRTNNSTQLPIEKDRFDEYSTTGVLLNQRTKRAPCVYQTNKFHAFGGSVSEIAIISYADDEGWLIEQVTTSADSKYGWVHQTRSIFDEPDPFVLMVPQVGTSDLN